MIQRIEKTKLPKSLKWGLAMAPFLVMFLVNETSRWQIDGTYQLMGINVINGDESNLSQCSWNCHNQTNYCKKHHVKYLKPHFHWVDPIYWGIVEALMSTGNYGLANIVFLVILWPFCMYWLLLRAIRNRKKLKLLKYGNR